MNPLDYLTTEKINPIIRDFNPELLRKIIYRMAGTAMIPTTEYWFWQQSELARMARLRPAVWNTDSHRLGLGTLFSTGHCSICHSSLEFPAGTFDPIQPGCFSCTSGKINLIHKAYVTIPITDWYPKYKIECIEFLNSGKIHF